MSPQAGTEKCFKKPIDIADVYDAAGAALIHWVTRLAEQSGQRNHVL